MNKYFVPVPLVFKFQSIGFNESPIFDNNHIHQQLVDFLFVKYSISFSIKSGENKLFYCDITYDSNIISKLDNVIDPLIPKDILKNYYKTWNYFLEFIYDCIK